ncbi:hypothetical protein Dimus_000805 [Dionaea muscipula]
MGHGPLGAKRKMNTSAPIELPKMKPTGPEFSKSTSLSFHQEEEDMDAFWDMLPKVDDATGSTAVGLSPKVVQEEALQEKEGVKEKSAETSSVPTTTVANQPPELLQRTTTIKDKGKTSEEVGPAFNQAPDSRIATAYAWVDEGLYARDQDILLAIDPRRLRGAMMVNATEQLQDDIANLQRDLQAKVDAESRVVQELSKVQLAQKSAEQMVTTQNETIKELRAENQMLKERVEHN